MSFASRSLEHFMARIVSWVLREWNEVLDG
jgi:hypothetical protein